MQMSEALAKIEVAEEEAISKGLSVEIMEIKPSVATELVDLLKSRCPPTT